jgi:O-acetyl-ADP-ribose deacetylase (regulator of RNase III)
MNLPIVELCVPNASNYDIANTIFGDHPGFIVKNTGIVEAEARVIVSPGNSFGEMNGGVDGTINTHLSAYSTYHRMDWYVQSSINERFAGELPVGSHVIISVIDHPKREWLIYTPTMRVAEEVSTGINAYLAFRSALLGAIDMNKIDKSDKKDFELIACPLFCTGAGSMNIHTACKQMREAYDSIKYGSLIKKDWQVYHTHHRMLKAL